MSKFKEIQELLPFMSEEEKALVTKGKPELLQYSYDEFVDLYNNHMGDEEKKLFDYEDLNYGGVGQALSSAPQTALGSLQMAGGGMMQAGGEMLDMPQTAQYGKEMFKAGKERAQEAFQAANLEPGSWTETAAMAAPEILQQAPGIALTAVNPAVGIPVVAATMGARSVGQTYGEAREKGNAPERALTKGVAYGAAEALGEVVGGKALTSMLKTPAGKSIIGGALKYLANEMGSELSTEGTQIGIDYLNKMTGGKEDEDLQAGKRMWETAKVTSLVAPVLGGVGGMSKVLSEGYARRNEPTATPPEAPIQGAETVNQAIEQTPELVNQILKEQYGFEAPTEQAVPQVVDQPAEEVPMLTQEQQQSPDMTEYLNKVNEQIGQPPIETAPAPNVPTPDFIQTTNEILRQQEQPKAPSNVQDFMGEVLKMQKAEEKKPSIPVEEPKAEAPKPIQIQMESIAAANIPDNLKASAIAELAKSAPVEKPIVSNAPVEPLSPPQSTIEEKTSATISEPEIIAPEPEKPVQEIAQPKIQEALPNDQKNIEGLPSEIGKGQEPIQAKPVEETGGEAVETGSLFQKQKEVNPVPVGKTPEERKTLRHDARNKIQGYSMLVPDSKAITEWAQRNNIEPTVEAIDGFVNDNLNIIENNLDETETSAVLPNLKKVVEVTKKRIDKAIPSAMEEPSTSVKPPKGFTPKPGMSAPIGTAKPQPNAPKRQPRQAAKLQGEKMIYFSDIQEAMADLEKMGLKGEVKLTDLKGARAKVTFDDRKNPTRYTIYIDRNIMEGVNEKELTQAGTHEFIGHVGAAVADSGITLSRGNVLGVVGKLVKYLKKRISLDPKVTEAALQAFRTATNKQGFPTPYAKKKAFEDTLKKARVPITDKEEIAAEAVELILDWEGKYADELTQDEMEYIRNPHEIHANIATVLVNHPKLLNDPKYSKIRALFKNYMDENGSEMKAIITELARKAAARKAGTESHINAKKMDEGYERGEKELYEQSLKERPESMPIGDSIMTQFVANTWIAQKLGDKIANAMQNLAFSKSIIQGKLMMAFPKLQGFLNENDISENDFGRYLELNRIDQEYRSKKKVASVEYDQAKRELDAMPKDQKDLLEQARKIFVEAMKPMKDFLIEGGAFPDTLNDAIRDNDYYATFKILSEEEEKRPLGTNNEYVQSLKAIKGHLSQKKVNPLTASLMTFTSAIRATLYNTAKKELAKTLTKEGIAKEIKVGFVEGKGYFGEGIEPGKRALIWRENGEVKGVAVDRKWADMFEMKDEKQIKPLMMINQFYRNLFTSKNPGFWPFAVIKDFFGSFIRMPGTVANFPSFVAHYGKALWGAMMKNEKFINDYRKGLEKGENIGNMEDIYGESYANAVDEKSFMNRLLQQYGISAPGMVKEQENINRGWLWLNALNEGLESVSKGLESAAKVSMRNYLESVKGKYNLDDEEINYMVRNFASQNFKERGEWTGVINHLLLFFNPFVQGVRSDVEALKKNPAGYAAKITLVSSLPLLALAAALKGNDELRKLLQEIPEYDKKNYMVWPLGRDYNGKPMYLRVPLNEMSKLLHGIMYEALLKPSIDGDLPRDIEGQMADLFGYAYGQVPQLTPIIDVAGVNLYTLMNKPYWDAYRERFIIPRKEVSAGLEYSWPELLKYDLEAFTGGWLSSTRKESDTPPGGWEKIMNAPGIKQTFGRFLKVSNAGIENREYATEKAQDRARSRETLKVEELYNKVKGGKANEAEKKEYRELLRRAEPGQKGARKYPNQIYVKRLANEQKKKSKKP